MTNGTSAGRWRLRSVHVLPDEALAVMFRNALTTSVALAVMLAATPLPSPDRPLAPPSSERSGDALRCAVRVEVGGLVTARGRVATKFARARVTLLRRDRGVFVPVDTGRVDARGRYLVRAAAPVAAGTYAHRVTIRSAGSTRTVRRFGVSVVDRASMTPTPTPVPPVGPQGDPADWTYLGGTRIARWDPCRTITWSVTGLAPYGEALVDLETAFSRLAVATGLTFEQVADPEASVFDVTWTNASSDARLAGTVVGFGGIRSFERLDGVSEVVSGYVLLDQDHTLPAGFAAVGSSWGKTMLHEMSHAVGLGHAAGADQLMYPQVARTPADFGAGDLAGLHAVGSSQGCLAPAA